MFSLKQEEEERRAAAERAKAEMVLTRALQQREAVPSAGFRPSLKALQTPSASLKNRTVADA